MHFDSGLLGVSVPAYVCVISSSLNYFHHKLLTEITFVEKRVINASVQAVAILHLCFSGAMFRIIAALGIFLMHRPVLSPAMRKYSGSQRVFQHVVQTNISLCGRRWSHSQSTSRRS
ncbi:hypothetical protein B0H12DRAFT_1100111 [Mycena haematopus]|nr:hypothetical protein B0H12DRAFT_1100111 [Mycena haematopus]